MNSKKKYFRSIKFLITLLFTCSPALATTYNIGPGQTYETYTALDAAIDLEPGDIVDCGGNTFAEQWALTSSGSEGIPIILRNAVIDGGSSIEQGLVLNNIDYVTIENVTVQNFTRRGIYLPNTGSDGTDPRYVTIDGCTVHSILSGDANDSQGIQFWGTNVTIRNSHVYNIGTDGIFGNGRAATVTGNNIHDVSVDDAQGDCVQITGYVDGLVLTNNILDHSSKDCKQALIVNGISEVDTAVNIISGNTMVGYENGATMYSVYLGYPGTAPYLVFSGNKVSYGYHGVWLTGSGILRNNLISDPAQRAVEVNTTTYPIRIYNNTIVSPNYGLRGIAVEATASDVEIKNNIVQGFSTYGLQLIASTVEDHNIAFGNGTDFFGKAAGTGSSTADPLLASDYSFKPHSPARNAGTTAGAVGLSGWQTDAFGKRRWHLSSDKMNIGASFDHSQADLRHKRINLGF